MANVIKPENIEEAVASPSVKTKYEVSENGNKIMKMTHVALLKEIAMKKENVYRNLGMIEEAKHSLLKDLEKVERDRVTLAKEIQSEYDLPENFLWQLKPDTREIIVSEQQ